MIRTVLIVIALGGIAAWMLAPAVKRWRDHLQHAPELRDADLRTTLLLAFKGLRTKMFARLMDGLGVALPAIEAMSQMIGTSGIDLNAVLPAIPLPFGDEGAALAPAQYMTGGLLLIGRVTDWLRNHTTTPPGTIAPNLAISAATSSKHVTGTAPSPSLTALVPASQIDLVRSAGGNRRQRATAKRNGKDARAKSKIRAKRKAA